MLSRSSSPSSLSASASCGARCRWLVAAAVVAVVLCLAALLPRVVSAVVAPLLALHASPSHAALFFAVIVLLCNPLTVGYGVVVFSAGLVFGWWAFPLVYCASVVGGALCFSLLRLLSARCGCGVHRLWELCPAYALYVRAFTSALEAAPVRSAALLQLSFLPYGALCALLSTTPIPLTAFVCACCVSRCKLLAYVWLAQNATTLRSLWSGERAHSWVDVATLALSLTSSVAALALLTALANRQLQRIQQEQSAQQQQQQQQQQQEEDEEGRAGDGDDDGADAGVRSRGRAVVEVGGVNGVNGALLADVERAGSAYDRLLSPPRFGRDSSSASWEDGAEDRSPTQEGDTDGEGAQWSSALLLADPPRSRKNSSTRSPNGAAAADGGVAGAAAAGGDGAASDVHVHDVRALHFLERADRKSARGLAQSNSSPSSASPPSSSSPSSSSSSVSPPAQSSAALSSPMSSARPQSSPRYFQAQF